jgi:transcriptional regulator with XRE-family HTH domain
MVPLAITATEGFSYGMELVQKLTRLMEARRLSQADVARAAGMQQTAISRVLSGKQRLYLDQAQRIADFLSVGVDYLADDTQDEPRPLNPESSLTEDERAILRLSRLLDPEQALLRLATEPVVRYGQGLAGRPAPPTGPTTPAE